MTDMIGTMERQEILVLRSLTALIISLLILWVTTSQAMSSTESALRPTVLLTWPKNGSDYVLIVDKTCQEVYVYHRDELSQPIKTYPCSTGENSGPKSKENDRKTPEGIYFITSAYAEEELSPIYGVYAFPLDYPNPFDRMEGKRGYGIWFHGLNKPLKPNDSNGCIAMNNWDIADLAYYIRIRETPVIITTRLEMVPSYRLDGEADLLEALIGNWRKAWQGKHIERYMSYYHSSFYSEGKSWDHWKAHKTKLAEIYEEIQVSIHDLWIFQNDGTAMALFYQYFKAPGFQSYGKKRLYLRQNSTEWKIMGEFYKEAPKKLWPLNAPAPISTPEKKRVLTLYGQP